MIKKPRLDLHKSNENIGQVFDENLGKLVPAAENRFAAIWHNLADPRIGAETILSSDEWFGPMERMLDHRAVQYIPGKYDQNGKWMDGWETRRRRAHGNDFCIVKLAVAGKIKAINIDTTFFTENFPPAASLDACYSETGPDKDTKWVEVLPPVSLNGDSQHLHELSIDGTWTHVRLNIYPDGGIARLRVYGEPTLNWDEANGNLVDLISIKNGGWLLECSDQHWGSPANIIYPGTGKNMGEGWETRRRREPGNEWALFRLGWPGTVEKVCVDTTHFKGNYPDKCSIRAAYIPGRDFSAMSSCNFWKYLLPEQKLKMDNAHFFSTEISEIGPISHILINLIPDGGVNRLRLLGKPTQTV